MDFLFGLDVEYLRAYVIFHVALPIFLSAIVSTLVSFLIIDLVYGGE